MAAAINGVERVQRFFASALKRGLCCNDPKSYGRTSNRNGSRLALDYWDVHAQCDLADNILHVILRCLLFHGHTCPIYPRIGVYFGGGRHLKIPKKKAKKACVIVVCCYFSQ